MAKILRVALLVMLLTCVSSTTPTAMMNVGDPWTGNSWGQRFYHQTDLDFEVMRIDWMSGSQFQLPTVFENFDDDSWTAAWEDPIFASALGGNLTGLAFDIVFSGEIVPSVFTFATYNQGTAQEYISAAYRDSPLPDMSWQFTMLDVGGAPQNPNPIPEPASFLLLGMGLIVAGIAGSRLRRRLL